MHSIFKNIDLQNQLNKDGYVVLSLLSKEDLNNLKQLYNNTIAQKSKHDLYESSRMNEKETNDKINSTIQQVIEPYVNDIFQDFTFYGGTFMIKVKDKSTELPLHQDWSVLEENLYHNLLFWIPLHDVSKENGTIFLIKGSHNYYDIYRSGSYTSKRINRKKLPQNYITTINLKAGEVLIYSTKIFHGSYQNKSVEDRKVATAMITSKNAPLTYYHKKSETEAEMYYIKPESYLNDITYISDGKVPPNATFVESIAYKHPNLNHFKLQEKIEGQPLTLWSKIKSSLFSTF